MTFSQQSDKCETLKQKKGNENGNGFNWTF